MSKLTKKAIEKIEVQGSVFNNREYSGVIGFIKKVLLPRFTNAGKNNNKEEQGKLLRVLGDISGQTKTLDSLKKTSVEIANDDNFSNGMTSNDDYMLSKALEGDYDFNISLDEDFKIDLKLNIPINNESALTFTEGTSEEPSYTQISVGDISDMITKNTKDKTYGGLISELQVFKKKGIDGEIATKMMWDQVQKSNMDKFTPENMRSLLYDPIVGTQVIANHLIEGLPGLQIDLPYKDINGNGVLEKWEKKAVLEEYVNRAEQNPEGPEFQELQWNWAHGVKTLGQKAAYNDGVNQANSKKQNNQKSNFDANSYKKV